MKRAIAGLMVGICCAAGAQWQMQESHTDASLRGIHSLGGGVAWASGTKGTVLRTVDGGKNWQTCAVPAGAEKLDFRGVQGFDKESAVVMSIGKGTSHLYETKDGCKSWTLLRTNADPDGFWDALVYTTPLTGSKGWDSGELVGDPINGRFQVSSLIGSHWEDEKGDPFAPAARTGESAFAASNSSVLSFGRADFMLGTGGTSGARVIFYRQQRVRGSRDQVEMAQESSEVPVGTKTESSGIFSLAARDRAQIMAVGGDYQKPNDSRATAAYTSDGGDHWAAAAVPPHGYRSAVAYDAALRAWITVGPNGTDVSMDDGKNWRPLTPGTGDAPDADKNWNALSLPFVVGPKGRIGVWEDEALGKK